MLCQQIDVLSYEVLKVQDRKFSLGYFHAFMLQVWWTWEEQFAFPPIYLKIWLRTCTQTTLWLHRYITDVTSIIIQPNAD